MASKEVDRRRHTTGVRGNQRFTESQSVGAITESPRFYRRPFALFHATISSTSRCGQKFCSASAGGMFPMGPSRCRLLYQSTQPSVAISGSCMLRHGPWREPAQSCRSHLPPQRGRFHTSHRRLTPTVRCQFGQTHGVTNGQILLTAIGVVNQATLLHMPSIVQGMFENIKDKVCLG